MDSAERLPSRSGAKKSLWTRLVQDMRKYIVVLPVVVWLILFCYKPMYGVVIAFFNFNARKGIDESPRVGIYHLPCILVVV